ncbi:glycerophosphodiester phosphodiesterase family protein [Nitratireductor sp. ZSWI3]|uniref:glycerophosphodiester phosphodiesterase family protein n=1 Tax=Nitratireductor sp. ZSWI3 TaxID=2966359 RepID=UPI0021504070|nr:glycerophosphodiester phosphodiesterase family protein [Nitratireductor sp. ZSWI3]MCR4268165.1 glycerophosphodiester phosphodiesterase [Nitratireductor sp. ZSWI3]
MRKRTVLLLALAGIAGALYLANASRLSGRPAGAPVLLAHRGLAQGFDRTGLTGQTCTAERMLPPRHAFLENTLPSMRAAFDLGADVVEIDIHPTTDGQFAVFHDWTVDCRTEGTGETRSLSMDELKSLDVGYGYTADGGKTFPFRGKGTGMIPSLDEVLFALPDRRFLINIKSSDAEEGRLLAEALARMTAPARSRLMVYGAEAPVDVLRSRFPRMKTLTRRDLKRCLPLYALAGWSGFVPEACRGRVLLLPVNIARWMWGWPNRFLDRMEAAGSEVFLLGPYAGGGFSTGFDDPALIKALPVGYSGGISTDALDLIAPLLEDRAHLQ